MQPRLSICIATLNRGDFIGETLDTIVKYEGDVRKAQEELKEYMRRVRARRGGTEAPVGPRAGSSDKDLLN